MKTIIFIAIFFSGSSIFSMNSTENRQALVELEDCDSLTQEIAQLDASLNMLYQEGQLGDIASQGAYDAFIAISNYNFPIISKRSMAKLAHYSLAYVHPGTHDYIVDNCKVDLWNQYRKNSNLRNM